MPVTVLGEHALTLPVGTTTQRPASPVSGMIRQNSTTGDPEWYDTVNGTWRSFAEKSANGYLVEYLVVAGGGAPAGSWSTAGGGGGGVLEGSLFVIPSTLYGVVVGAGAAFNASNSLANTSGSNSLFQDLIAIGGGGGGGFAANGQRGGSGGGGGSSVDGSPTQPSGPVMAQGFSGGNGNFFGVGSTYAGGGGGGAGGAGGNATSNTSSGRGGPGHRSNITGAFTFYAAGGAGGIGSSGSAQTGGEGSTNPGVSGGANTGTGGGGNSGGNSTPKGNGGSGIVVVRYPGAQRGAGGTITTPTINGVAFTIHTFTSSGTYTA